MSINAGGGKNSVYTGEGLDLKTEDGIIRKYYRDKNIGTWNTPDGRNEENAFAGKISNYIAHLHMVGTKVLIPILLLMFILLIVCIGFTIDYSSKFYDIISSGQDSLCNFYTCSDESECGHFPKIILADGTEKCLTN